MTTGTRRNVHPFPARMAPSIALDRIAELSKPGDTVLDPMCGSGTVPRVASSMDRKIVACDVDPLAVLMTRVACRPSMSKGLAERANHVVAMARGLNTELPKWIAIDKESTAFVNYWFASKQRDQLATLAKVIAPLPVDDDPLRLALSRIIVTKSGGASLARDTSHSRPHRVTQDNDADVYALFCKSAAYLESLLRSYPSTTPELDIRLADALELPHVPDRSVDLIITSPPYLNAIDYIRGHKLALVWLGWRTSDLRQIRRESIGSVVAPSSIPDDIQSIAEQSVPTFPQLSTANQRLILRYTSDTDRLYTTLGRVSRPEASLVVVLADSTIRSLPVPTSQIAISLASKHGFTLVDDVSRPLPTQHRYLPPPESQSSSFSSRMKLERILTFSATAKPSY